jgi:ApaG protein
MISILHDQIKPDSDIIVRAVSAYMPDESDLADPDDKRYVFAYHIEIENQSSAPVKLLSRLWWITDSAKGVREVQGEGVVGQQPVIPPGQVFAYSSWCVLATPSGWMRGAYSMLVAGSDIVEVPIPLFSLATPTELN